MSGKPAHSMQGTDEDIIAGVAFAAGDPPRHRRRIRVVDRSGEDSAGETIPEVLETFEVDAAGRLGPVPNPEDYPDVRTEADLRRHFANSSFLSVDEAEPSCTA